MHYIFYLSIIETNFEYCFRDQDVAFPSVTTVRCKDGLTFGAGTASGQILLYDLRSSRPLFVKDHMYGLPIRDLDFHHTQNLALSLDASVLKIWNCQTVSVFVVGIKNTKKQY